MSFFARWRNALASSRPDGAAALAIADPRYDDWEVLRELDDIDTARAWCQLLVEHGVEAAITADHPPDAFGRGDIYLQVPPGRWSEAEELLGELD